MEQRRKVVTKEEGRTVERVRNRCWELQLQKGRKEEKAEGRDRGNKTRRSERGSTYRMGDGTKEMMKESKNIPSECFEVMRSLSGVSAPMKMMQPFDFSVSVYGGVVCSSRAAHYQTRSDRVRLNDQRKHAPWSTEPPRC